MLCILKLNIDTPNKTGVNLKVEMLLIAVFFKHYTQINGCAIDLIIMQLSGSENSIKGQFLEPSDQLSYCQVKSSI